MYSLTQGLLARSAVALALSGALTAAFAQTTAAPTPTPAAVAMPGDDFYAYANGTWLAATEIPADRGSWGAGYVLADETNQRITQLIEEAAQRTSGTDPRRAADYYRAFMDEAGIEARGAAPLQPVLKRIAAIADKKSLAQALGASLRADVDPLNAPTITSRTCCRAAWACRTARSTWTTMSA